MLDQIGKYFLANGEIKTTDQFPEYGHRTEYAPAIYEVIRVEDGVALFLEDYLERMHLSFARLDLSIPFDDGKLVEDIYRLIRINNHKSGPVKLVFGYGKGPFTVLYLMKPHLPSPQEYRTGVKTVMMIETRENPNVKSWNQGLRERSVKRLEESGAYEAILIDKNGNITEASRSNVFFILGERVFTSPVQHVLPGITRKKVLEICEKNGIPLKYKQISASEISHYEGCFLTGTARRVVPVKTVDNINFIPDTPLFRKIADAFEARVQEYIGQHR